MPQDVSTRWNSTYDMLKFVCTYHEAIDKITDDQSMKLCEFELRDDEWKIVEELRDTLKVRFHIDWMHAELVNACDNESYLSAIQAALEVGKKLLDKYYSITDNSEVYRIAMSTFFYFIIMFRQFN